MMPNFKVALLGLMLVLTGMARVSAASGDGPLVVVELQTEENTLDGCTTCGCRVVGEIEPGEDGRWWFVYALAKQHAEEEWVPVVTSSHCGRGSFEEIGSDFWRTVGIPYFVTELSVTAVVSEGKVALGARLSLDKLSGFDDKAQPVYASRREERSLDFTDEAAVTLPLLIPDQHEKESLGTHEVLLLMRATKLARKVAASYGTIAVSADVPGAKVYLDGGFVGRIAEGAPTVLDNVETGAREIAVRDFSGREARKQVVVENNKTAEATLDVLKLSPESQDGLVPIGKNPQGQEEYWRAKDRAIVVRVPAGEFLMGNPEGEGEPREHPQRSVYVSEFLIDKTEVTWRQFLKYAEATGAELPQAPVWGRRADYPMSFVIWEKARDYCEWAGGRLPTEAEWEKSARGTDGRKYVWGDEWDRQRCNTIAGGPHRPESVGTFPGCVSPYGVLDMPGSMWEWTADWFQVDYYTEGALRDPEGAESGTHRVIRGGAWMSQPMWTRTAARFGGVPTSPHADHAFRCAQDVPEEE